VKVDNRLHAPGHFSRKEIGERRLDLSHTRSGHWRGKTTFAPDKTSDVVLLNEDQIQKEPHFYSVNRRINYHSIRSMFDNHSTHTSVYNIM
jgi:hypothetical protein